MSPTMRSLEIPVSDRQPAKAMYTTLLRTPHADESDDVGYDIDRFEAALNPAGHGGGPVASADVEDLDAIQDTSLATGTTGRDARVRSNLRSGTVYPPMGTAIPWGDTETRDRARERTAFSAD